ncbi:FAD/NAD(P)-binding protein [Neptuniibacter sp. CAU 1671]|uniref:FAD/NAD(P)-binding protein n=1 Tax=Neptuniibacter sp. CAU 1671 TaxID=3032593 RepID=UPI0023DBB500|nr:FAD/NAD(P)-binding protein [Neptuniibacter sp. CAU 1671]MDF2181262.1 FAD/NAD(P)-binding protein [Neptuniibacter sp. CAU 1671]
MNMAELYRPMQAEVREVIHESPTIFTLRLELVDPAERRCYQFRPGQFNMLYLFGVGEVPISIVSDPADEQLIDHTIRIVGRVTEGMAKLQVGDRLGLRGPFGRGWPMRQAQGSDLVVVTGGLGCAPVVAAINYALKRRDRFGKICVVQGVKHSNDLIWAEMYARWRQLPDVQVLLAADQAGQGWPFHQGRITELLDQITADLPNALAMVCGPEGLMHAAAEKLIELGQPPEHIYLSLERNMQCAVGHCGHCQFGADFICHDGPVFTYPQVADRLCTEGV